jgi:hypothetical protein
VSLLLEQKIQQRGSCFDLFVKMQFKGPNKDRKSDSLGLIMATTSQSAQAATHFLLTV